MGVDSYRLLRVGTTQEIQTRTRGAWYRVQRHQTVNLPCHQTFDSKVEMGNTRREVA
jgi:hypothetical protein